MISEKKALHFLFITTIIGLFIFKWTDFHLPYFWDELGVYSRAADYQFHHRISLMPSSLPPWFSRGHPLLFTFIIASVERIFGEQIFVEHLFCFFISAVLLLTVYVKTSRYFNPITGFAASFILAIQPLFLAQSCLVLPEIMLALFIFMALCCYYENKLWQYTLFASMAILTKEAAIVLPATVFFYSVLSCIFTRVKPQTFKFSGLFLTMVPYLIFGAFLLLQKEQNGWYFFPMHINSIAVDVHVLTRQFHNFTCFLATGQGRELTTMTCVVGSAVALLSGKLNISRIGRSFTLLLLLLGFAFLAFCSVVDIYLERYITTVMVATSILMAAAINSISTKRSFVGPVLLVLLIISTHHLESNLFDYDADLGYRRDVNVVHEAVNYIVQIAKPAEKIIANFPIEAALSFGAGGYLNENRPYFLVNAPHRNYGDYLVLCTPGPDIELDSVKFEIYEIKSFVDGYARVDIYQIKKR